MDEVSRLVSAIEDAVAQSDLDRIVDLHPAVFAAIKDAVTSSPSLAPRFAALVGRLRGRVDRETEIGSEVADLCKDVGDALYKPLRRLLWGAAEDETSLTRLVDDLNGDINHAAIVTDGPVLSFFLGNDVSIPVLATLVAAGADLIGDADTTRPFLKACVQGNSDAIRFFHARGVPTDFAPTEWEWALGVNARSVLDALLETVPIASFGPAMLGAASRYGASDDMRQLLGLGVSPNVMSTALGSPLLVSLAFTEARPGLEEKIMLLLDHGADVDMTSNDGHTALIAAAMMGHRRIAELLIARGADVNAVSLDGKGVLASCRDPAMASFLAGLGVPGELPMASARQPDVPVERHVMVIRASDRELQLDFADDYHAWAELYLSCGAVTGDEPEQVREGAVLLGRISSQLPFAEVVRIVIEGGSGVSTETAKLLRDGWD